MAISVNADAKLRFLRGLEANLPATMTDGYVYVTTDTRAMYVDYTDANKKLARIRIGDVLTVANVAALPAIADAKDGVLYYCAAENILCTPGAVDGVRKWRQINEQKTLGNLIQAMSFTASDGETGVDLSFMILGSNNEIKNASTGFLNGANVKIVSNGLGNGVKIGAKDTTVTGAISAGSVTGGAEIKLTNTTGGTDATGTELTGTAEGGSVQIVGKGVTVSQAANKITVDGALKSVTNAFDADGKFTTTVVQATDDAVTADAVTPTVRYGLAKDSEGNPVKTATFKSGNADLSVYTIAETDAAIESKLKAANAMTFKGTLGSAGATATELPTSAALGDTYIVAEKGTYYYKKTADAASNTAQSC